MMRRSRQFFVLPILAAALVLDGCNVARITLNTPITMNDVTFIEPGRTHLSDVIAKLGAPDSMTDSDNGVVVTYRFLDMRYSRVNLGWLAKPWSPVDPDLIFSRLGLGVDAFQVLCDSGFVVQHRSFLRHLAGPQFTPYPF
ncbi:conserved protein of unknown function [Nitrospira japonica]|uniref:Uncharacterized protein n=1 Tax=Nitrospira japonica TaxID=1325564 RepID=A0A1W1I3V6_9BACT|nr:hypothetical protein [Nitrospira japonica]SLM47549.1 conserved protein of unknown function [Nitrospira japonica]